ncbi:hypothetical protein VitviT2T_003614 [Vitis vinifera]|uniref:DM2 domain-containing protein n=2 Tax=Vitis vinifera TaxID=29760 RepID=A0ABY9BN88_VITVI|nr:upstream activation factor subunit spp27 [Vitis vinifera]XP_034682058.1 upstream activation factor subunit spp27-like [Vitis riparia]WJZ83978.1 hypothetical protein VitviT2T_003614 [Vitis vinifera]|eukprot:XP_002272147.1 PREDICTED: upstream activation factor subunit spp27 [Vitis vinifera]
MAMSLGVISTFFSGETASFSKSALSLTSLRHLPPPSPHTNLRLVRTVTSAAASKPPAAATGKREPRGIMKPRRISPEMQDFLGVPEIPRTQALKQIWAYIKQHNLQDPENKKIIVCDEKLKSIFAGKDRVGFLEIAGLINPHFLK